MCDSMDAADPSFLYTIEEEIDQNGSDIKRQLRKLVLENESYNQEIYELRRKLEVSIATQKEMSEINASLESTIAERAIHAENTIACLQCRLSNEKKEYSERLFQLETDLAQRDQEIMNLKKTIVELKKIEPVTIDGPDYSDSINEVTKPLIEKVAVLSSIIEEQYKKQTQYEELVPALEQQYRECNEILNVTKEELASKNAILESNQEELAVCRMELQSIKSAPSDIHKGNSIFAEVEDRRRCMLKKMADLRNNYQEIKQMYHNKEIEFNIFRSQYAAMFHKADNTANILEDKEKLLTVYKDRVAELENKLKEEQMKDKQKEKKQSTGKDFSYLEILLAEKTKEIEELQKKLEHTSIQRILTANTEYTLKDELRHWKRKAFSYESELITLKNKSELKHINDEIKNCNLWENKFDMNKDESSKNQNMMNDTIKIPERQISQKVIGHNIEEKINESLNASTDITGNDMELTRMIPSIIHKELPGKCILKNTSSIPLKSAILKPDQALKHLESGYKEKEKKSLRFSPDTVDSVSQQVKRDLKTTKKEYPIIYIATNKQ